MTLTEDFHALIQDLSRHIREEVPEGFREETPFEVFEDYKAKYAKKEAPPPSAPAPKAAPEVKKVSDNAFRAFFEKRYPQVKLVDAPLRPTEISETIFLCLHGEEEWERFYDKVAKAIRDRGQKVSVLEANAFEKAMPHHLLVAREELLARFSGNTTIPLPNELKSCQETSNKRKLWATLCHLLKL